ncbi:MAG: nucleotidyl transferase AbiEii/AbiGii toxin family protein, partial [Actinobacteria bacterium]|nr:nucleotidyl transferase AbiEii/AbiGii toxin family protein [Actinomycetota bacterium]
FAVSAYADPRITRDVDLAVAVESDTQAEAVVGTLRGRGYELLALVDHGPTGRLATARLAAPVPAPVMVDLLFASSGIEPELVARARRLELIPGLVAPVAAPGDLVALKLLARDDATRPQDPFDLAALAAVLDEQDRRVAGEAVRLITARGFNRDRDLAALLERYLACLES